MKQIILSSAVVIAILITNAAMANSTSKKNTPSIVKHIISLDINTPAPGDTWDFSSKQYAEWSISGLPSGKYKIVVFLKNLTDCQKGIIAATPVSNGKGHVQFVVNEVAYVDGIYALTNGKFEFSLAIYEEKITNNMDLGNKIIEKDGGFINIEGSDVSLGKQRKY